MVAWEHTWQHFMMTSRYYLASQFDLLGATLDCNDRVTATPPRSRTQQLATDDLPFSVNAKLIGQLGHLELSRPAPHDLPGSQSPLYYDIPSAPLWLRIVRKHCQVVQYPSLPCVAPFPFPNRTLAFPPPPTQPSTQGSQVFFTSSPDRHYTPQDPLHGSAYSSGGMPMDAGHPLLPLHRGSAAGNNTSSTQEPRKEGSGTVDRFAVGRSCIGGHFVAPSTQ